MNINEILKTPAFNAAGPHGAAMGRRNQTEGNPEKLHLQKVKFIDSCYDVGGAYWGLPENLWCAFSTINTENEFSVFIFTRADTREQAKKNILEELKTSGWTFFK